ncbi:MAG: N-acetylmuramoyl-L-alanine amidase [Myxococcales bacterium]|nr:N-acetylmuramoyl-L-alanine amidase [Myxococcales bacterium]
MAKKKSTTKKAKRGTANAKKPASKSAPEKEPTGPAASPEAEATRDTLPPEPPPETAASRDDEPTVKVWLDETVRGPSLSGIERAEAAVAASAPDRNERDPLEYAKGLPGFGGPDSDRPGSHRGRPDFYGDDPELIEATRDRLVEAVYLEALDQGCSKRDALRIAEDSVDRLRLPDGCEPSERLPDVEFYDLRAEQDYQYPGGKHKVRMRGRAPMRRNLADVDTLVVHQTAAEFGVSRRAVQLADGDVELARARRALDVACHVMAFRAGYFVAAHDLDVYVNHGNRFNATSFGLEIDGRYPGLRDDPDTIAREDLRTTWGGPPTELTDETVRAACAAIGWLYTEAERNGGGLRKIVSHRQSNDDRRSDPGQEIWERVVLDFAVDEVGLEAVLDSKWRQGRPVPTQWDPDGIGSY